MKLTGVQIQRLCDGLVDGYSVESFHIFLRFHLDKSIDDVSSPGTKPERFFSAIENSEQKEWLCELLAQLAQHGANGSLKSTAGNLLSKVCERGGRGSNGGDPLQSCLVGSRPFVNRETFRYLMSEFRQDPTRLLLIKGSSGGGNSHSWYFIQHLARHDQASARLVDLKEWQKPNGPSPEEVLESIYDRLALPTTGWKLDDLAQGDRRSIKLVNRFIGDSPGLASHYWLVIDHLDRVDLPEATLELAERLAIAVARGNCERISLALIGFPRSLPADLEPFILRDTPSGFGEPEVRRHFMRLAEQHRRAMAGEALEALVAKTFEGFSPPRNKDQMYQIAGRLASLSASVVRGEGLP